MLDDSDLPFAADDEQLSAMSPDNESIPTSDSSPPSEQWEQFLAAESGLNKADWSCREDFYQAHIGGLTPAIEDFAASHRSEVLKAQGEWTNIADMAQQLGYHGQQGPLGG